MIDVDNIKEAHNRIKKYINITPVLTNSTIDKMIGANVYFKCENFQKVGAFKYRGATNALLSMGKTALKKGVATHSSGNHAQALSLSAKKIGVPAFIVMPINSPKVKISAVKDYGAEVVFCEPTLEAREAELNKIIEKTGAEFVHPYNRKEIIEGQGTAALEFLESQPNLDVIITPVGGGGLLSGTAIYSKGFNAKIQVYGAEPKGADDAFRSFSSGTLTPSVNPRTICDGLLTSLGEINFEYIKKYVNDILLADDYQVVEAMKLIYERMKIIVEPSSAIALAVVLNRKEIFEGKNVGIILSGGNVDIQPFFDTFNMY